MRMKNVFQNIVAISLTTGALSPTQSFAQTFQRSGSGSNFAATMAPARVGSNYTCPLFENRPHAELIAAIDTLNKEVRSSPDCDNSPSAKTLTNNGDAISKSIATLQTAMKTTDASQLNLEQVDQAMTSALTAIGNIGDIINNNSFLNSKCGRQTMSTGKALLAVNEVINGLAPYALFAVSMNAALAPALPYVVGGTIATSGITAMSKMVSSNTLDMNNPDHRKAILQNTCQYTKIAKQIRFMQLAQSGKIDKITQELEKDVELYKTQYGKPNQELTALLKYRDTSLRTNQAVEKQVTKDESDIQAIDEQLKINSDNLLVCIMSQELINWSKDGKTFPASVFVNLEKAASQGDRTSKLQAITMKTLHSNAVKRITEVAGKSGHDEAALKICADTGRSWIAGIRQTVALTKSIAKKNSADLEAELSQNKNYRQWKVQYSRIEEQRLTISRVEKAMQELAKDTSIIDRSELAQSIVDLKAGLFGARRSWNFGIPPVLAWINHTKNMHDQAISAFTISLDAVKASSFSLTPVGRGQMNKVSYKDAQTISDSNRSALKLENINLSNLPVGSREQDLMCQQLESAWLDWSASIDHLGAIQFFCDMIDPYLDIKMDAALIRACRGDIKVNGQTTKKSIVGEAKDILLKKGFQDMATLVGQKMKDLKCPMPAVPDVNQKVEVYSK